MKVLLLASVVVAHGTAPSAVPSAELVRSCLAAKASSTAVTVEELPTNEVLTDESYRPGVAATYLLALKDGDVGLARDSAGDALISSGRLYPLRTARLIQDARRADSFEPQLASWLRLREHGRAYLCVSFNFAGLGQSGSFQRIRGGYLLPLAPKKGKPQLFYAVSDTGTPGNAPQ